MLASSDDDDEGADGVGLLASGRSPVTPTDAAAAAPLLLTKKAGGGNGNIDANAPPSASSSASQQQSQSQQSNRWFSSSSAARPPPSPHSGGGGGRGSGAAAGVASEGRLGSFFRAAFKVCFFETQERKKNVGLDLLLLSHHLPTSDTVSLSFFHPEQPNKPAEVPIIPDFDPEELTAQKVCCCEFSFFPFLIIKLSSFAHLLPLSPRNTSIFSARVGPAPPGLERGRNQKALWQRERERRGREHGRRSG